ncbi:Ricin B-like lectin EULS3, partial [Mucuna pruriens]
MEYPFNQAQQHHRRDEDERPNTYPPPGISSTYSDVPKPEAHLLHSSHVTSEHMSQDFDYSAPPPSAPFDHRPHGYPPAPAAADYSCHKVTTALSSKPTVRVLAKADPNFSPTIRHGQVILAPSNPTNEYQHCYEDEKYSTRVKDEEATGEALKHSVGATHPVRSLSQLLKNICDY